ncbi:MAG: ISH3 family transposase [Thermoplasmata archaeon]
MRRDGNTKRKKFRASISDKQLSKWVVGLILPLFSFTGLKGSQLKGLARVVVLACAGKSSINQAVKKVKKRLTAGAFRHHLRKGVDIGLIEKRTNTILQQIAKKILSGKWLEFAVDFVYIPYHGQHMKEENEIVRSKAKHGTTHFHAYATLYVIVLGKRFTLAVRYVKKKTPKVEILEFFRKTIYDLDIHIKTLYIDKGFCSVEVINYLKRRHIRAVIAVPQKGKKNGVKSLLGGRNSRIVRYPMKSGQGRTAKTAEFDMAIVCKYAKNKYGRKGVVYFTYGLINIKIKPGECYQKYRKRFGIESSYRMMNVTRARTSSRSPELRLIYVGVSLILQNAWIYLNWTYMRERRQGVRKPKEGLTLNSFLDMIIQGLKAIMGKITVIIPVNYPTRKINLFYTLLPYTGGESV